MEEHFWEKGKKMKARGLFHGFVCGLFFGLALANIGAADTSVSGFIFTDTIWTLAGSPYIVVDNVFIDSSATLTVEPGVTVKFNNAKALQIDGTLIARGTSSNKVTFTSNQATPAAGDWHYILFTDSSVDATFDGNDEYVSGSILEYCRVEFGGATVPSGNPPNSGTIRIEASSPFVNHCLIENNDTSGIHIINGAAPRISCNTINSNSARNGGGIFAISNGVVRITNNTIKNNYATIRGVSGWGPGGGGIFARGVSIIIDKNIVRNNSSTYGGGIYVENSNVTNNIIFNNSVGYGEGAGIYVDDGSTQANGNIIVNNSSTSGSAGIYARSGATVTNNSIIGNAISEPSKIVFVDAAGALLYGVNFNYNTVLNNVVPGSIDAGGVSINSSTLPVNYNNIYNNSGVDLYNNNRQGSPNLNAENNWWGTTVESEILAKIYDWFDDATLGIVDYSPYETAIRTDAPISPPTGLAVSTTDTDIILTWSPNPEGDVAGYKVYWGKQEPPFFENVANVGNSLGHTIPGLTAGIYYVGVTAYDTEYVDANDDPNTIVNENQTNGNESWYASTVAFVGTPEPRVLTLLTPNGGERLVAGNTSAISWQSQGPIDSVLIEYSTDNGSNWVPIGTVTNTGLYEWLVPSVTSDQCLVAITDATNAAITDTSDGMFTIIQCSRVIPSDLNRELLRRFLRFCTFC